MEKEIIKSIEEITDLRLGNMGKSTDNARLGVAQLLSSLLGYCSYDGYKIITSKHEYLLLINNEQSCCENWGYFSCEDNFNSFIGKTLISVEFTDTALNKNKLKKFELEDIDKNQIQFIDFKVDTGEVLQFAVYNEHNGYYGHSILFAKDEDILLNSTL